MHRQELLDKLVEIDSGDYAASHYDRFIASYNFIEPYLKPGLVCADIGSYGHFQKLVQAFNPDIVFPQIRTDFDLRYPFPIATNKFDLVFCMEVIEHMKDQDENGNIEKLAEYDQSGVHNLMSELNRVLKPGGKLFLTTPNIGSFMSIHRALSHYSPTFYLPHVKEWSLDEMYHLHINHGLRPELIDTADVFGEMSGGHKRNEATVGKIRGMCAQLGYSTDMRGDIMMFLSEK